MTSIIGTRDDQAITRMLWKHSEEPLPTCPELFGPQSADVVVIGGGFAGLSAALHLATAGKSVAVLEARYPGWGASGRNGGQVNPGFQIPPSEVVERYGPELGQRLVDLSGAACDLVFNLIDRFDINCEARRPGYVQAAVGKRGLQIRDRLVRAWQGQGMNVQSLDADEISLLLGARGYSGGYVDPRGGNLNPTSYARGLARGVISNGTTIFGNSPAVSIDQHADHWCVTCPNGHVKAKYLCLVTNAYTGTLWPQLKNTLIPVRSFITATQRLSSEQLSEILPGGHAVSETRRIALYYRTNAEGRLVMGGRGNQFNSDWNGPTKHLEKEALNLFPSLKGVFWEFQWSGLVGMNFKRMPSAIQLGENAFALNAFNGRGVAMATAMGKELANLIIDPSRPNALPIQALNKIPFHPLRQFGVSVKVSTGGLLDKLDAFL
jgi:glycine/D-amino acid oxidase-like deaminating enzyme